MTFDALLFQALNGLAAASGLFFVAAGLSLIFGVTRIVNMAHGSLYMLGTYIAYTFATRIGGGLGFWGGIVARAAVVGRSARSSRSCCCGASIARPSCSSCSPPSRCCSSSTTRCCGCGDRRICSGRARPACASAVEILGRRLPSYDLFLIAIAPLALLVLHLVLARTRFGRLVRAATQDREMVGALGVNQALLFTAVFALGSFLAGLGGALQIAREPANLAMDLTVLGDAFVVVVVGGMGSITGAYLAAVLIAEIKALCIGIGLVVSAASR